MKHTRSLSARLVASNCIASRRCAFALAVIALLALDASAAPPAADAVPTQVTQGFTRSADFAAAKPSTDTRHLANWIADSGDNEDAPFIVVDKIHARAWVFGADARLRAVSPVLLGLAPGDYSVPGIGLRPMQDILPHERTTPAGRFVAEPGRNLSGEDIIWVDYDAAVSMHRVRPNNPAEKRLERLASPSPNDNRISYGCINVPVAFYETYVSPIFDKGTAIIYVLPDSRTVQAVFGSYDVTIANTAPNDAPSEVATR